MDTGLAVTKAYLYVLLVIWVILRTALQCRRCCWILREKRLACIAEEGLKFIPLTAFQFLFFFLTGDTLIVEEDATRPDTKSPVVTKRTAQHPVREVVPVLARKVVPADNSCLFTSIYYVVEGGVYEPACAPEMRSLIAQIVASDPEFYSEAVLGKTNQEYCDWIRRDDTWGGAIEVSILSKFYQCEICVVDTQTVRIDRFGEDAGYAKRVLLIYDGIHYDPLERKIPNSDVPPQTIFSAADDIVLAQALELAEEARRKRQFTDVNRFTLRCMVCQKGFTGQVEAREHAKETGHTNFGEV